MSRSGLIFDIKRYSINDGPGIRITVFFKGCPMACTWCHNPESQSPDLQKFYSSSNCIGCGKCIEKCPPEALRFDKAQSVVTDTRKCTLCGNCAVVCPTGAMEMVGKEESVENIMQTIRQETLIMDTSGGGVTFSGGEPLMHPDLLLELLIQCGRENIHRAVDTAGLVKIEVLKAVAKHTDLFLYDLKHMDPIIHKRHTGVDNHIILKNLSFLSETGNKIHIRIPLIEGFNADDQNIESTASFITTLPGGIVPVFLLPYHSIASHKYMKMGGSYDPGELAEPDIQRINRCMDIFKHHGIPVSMGG